MLHQIGAGVLGPVFRTYDAENDRLVAVKALRIDLTPELQGRLVAELDAIVALELDHPSLVNMVGAGIEGTTAYVAEEYVGAESLDVALRHYAPAPIQTILPFIKQLAGAIDFARAAGVMHGALHPRDIFLTPDTARATGFGMSRALEAVGVRASVRRPYSAPERVAGSEWGTEADVYALAAITWELLTAKRIAGAGDPFGTTSAEGHPNVYPALLDVLETALAAEPGRRYPSALVLVAALTKAIAVAPAIETPADEPSSDQPEERPTRDRIGGVKPPSEPAVEVAHLPFEGTAEDAGARRSARPAASHDAAAESREADAEASFLDDMGDLPAEWLPTGTRAEQDGGLDMADPSRLSWEPDRGSGAADALDEPAEFDEGNPLDVIGDTDDVDDTDDGDGIEVPQPVAAASRPAEQSATAREFDRARDRLTGPEGSGEIERMALEAGRLGPAGDAPVSGLSGGASRRFADLLDDDDDDAGGVDDESESEHGSPDAPERPSRAWAAPVRRWPGGPPSVASRWSTTVLGSSVGVALLVGFIAGYFWRGPATVSSAGPTMPSDVSAYRGDDVEAAPAPVRAAGPDVSPPAPTPPTGSAPAPVTSSSPAGVAGAAVLPEVAGAPSTPPGRQEAATSSRVSDPPAVPRASNGPVVPASNRDGRLLIRTTPAGASVSVDGRARGISPVAIRDLEYGAYTVRVALPGYEPQTTRLSVTRERPAASVTLDLVRNASPGIPSQSPDLGALFIDSRPRGARVFVDDRPIGTTPMQMLELPAGAHEVRLELDGYRTWTSAVQVRSGETSRVTGSLDQQRF